MDFQSQLSQIAQVSITLSLTANSPTFESQKLYNEDSTTRPTDMTHNRRYANRPDKHAKKEVNNKNPVGNTLDTQFVIRSDGRIGRLYAYGHHYSGDHFNDPVQWRELDDGRNYITHEGKKLYAHHLVWFLVHGEMPKQIKFKDGDKSNFNVENLVAQGIRKPTYQARVRVGDTIRCLGSYPTREAAVEAQDAFKALRAMGIV